MPVVQSGPLDGLFRNIKAQGFDQVQAAAGGGTGAGNIAAVLWNLRLKEHDVQHDFHLASKAGHKAPSFAPLLYAKVSRKSTQKTKFFQLF